MAKKSAKKSTKKSPAKKAPKAKVDSKPKANKSRFILLVNNREISRHASYSGATGASVSRATANDSVCVQDTEAAVGDGCIWNRGADGAWRETGTKKGRV